MSDQDHQQPSFKETFQAQFNGMVATIEELGNSFVTDNGRLFVLDTKDFMGEEDLYRGAVCEN